MPNEPTISSLGRGWCSRLPTVLGILCGILLFLGSTPSLIGALTPASDLPSEVKLGPDLQRYGLIVVDTTFEDGTVAKLILDTGTPVTTFDESLAKHLGKKLDSQPKIEAIARYQAPKLFLNGTRLVFDDPVLTDTTPDLVGKYANVRGVLGFDCLKHYCIQIDPVSGTLRFLDAKRLDKRELGTRHEIGLQKLWMQGMPSVPFVRSNLIGEEKTASLLTTLQKLDGTLHWKTFKRYQSSGRISVQAAGQPGLGIPYSVGLLGETRFGGGRYTNLVIGNNPRLDTIGLHFLVRHVATLDFPGEMLYLKPIDSSTVNEIPRFDNSIEPIVEPKGHTATDDKPGK